MANDPNVISLFIRWLASNGQVPRFRNRVNKAEVCRQIGIARSTADKNPMLRALFTALESGKLEKLNITRTNPSSITQLSHIKSSARVSSHRVHPDHVPDPATVEHLIKTGRLIR